MKIKNEIKIVTFKIKVNNEVFELSLKTDDKDNVIQFFYKLRCKFYENILQNNECEYICILEYLDTETLDSRLEKQFIVKQDDFDKGYSDMFCNILLNIKKFIEF